MVDSLHSTLYDIVRVSTPSSLYRLSIIAVIKHSIPYSSIPEDVKSYLDRIINPMREICGALRRSSTLDRGLPVTQLRPTKDQLTNLSEDTFLDKHTTTLSADKHRFTVTRYSPYFYIGSAKTKGNRTWGSELGDDSRLMEAIQRSFTDDRYFQYHKNYVTCNSHVGYNGTVYSNLLGTGTITSHHRLDLESITKLTPNLIHILSNYSLYVNHQSNLCIWLIPDQPIKLLVIDDRIEHDSLRDIIRSIFSSHVELKF